jgi:hypothetical protein
MARLPPCGVYWLATSSRRPLRRAGPNSTTVRFAAAEAAFDILITTDQNLRYQQNLSGLRLAILVLPTTSWPKLRSHEAQIVAAVNALRPGDVVVLSFS